MKRIALLVVLLTARASAAPIVDFDGDGLADIAVPGTDLHGEVCQHGVCYRPDDDAHEVIALFLGKDHGKLSRLVRIATRPHEYDRAVEGYIQRIGAVGDLDGDGRTDLALQWEKAGESLLLLRGSKNGIESKPYQTIAMPQVADLAWYNMDARPAGDVDGDGRPDIVIGNAVMHGIGSGKLGPPQQIKPSAELAVLYPVGDVDGDGKADLVAADISDGKSWLVRGDKATPLAIDRFTAAVDIDGDGRRELIGARQKKSLVTLTVYSWTKGAPVATTTLQLQRLKAMSTPKRRLPS